MAVNTSVLTVIIVLVPMFYLLLASPAFLFVHLRTPQVARLLRAMFLGYFMALAILGSVAAAVDSLSGHLLQAVFLGTFTVGVFLCRLWAMPRIDALLEEINNGIASAPAKLRQLHWMGMATNAALTAVVVAFIPALVVIA